MGNHDEKSARHRDRLERLSQALKDNLAKRKAQARARKTCASNLTEPGQGTGGDAGEAKNPDEE
jgi:hypothetical protein